MKIIIQLFLVLNMGFAYAQTNKKMKFNVTDIYKRDSIVIKNSVEFYTYSDVNTLPTPAVKFKVEIINLGEQGIPNLMRVGNRSEYLELYYNDKNSYDPSIENGLTGNDWPWVIKKNESDTFETGFILSENSGISTYGNPFKVRWSYMGIDSPIVIVDIIGKCIIEN